MIRSLHWQAIGWAVLSLKYLAYQIILTPLQGPISYNHTEFDHHCINLDSFSYLTYTCPGLVDTHTADQVSKN